MYLTLFLPADGKNDNTIAWLNQWPLKSQLASGPDGKPVTVQVMRDTDPRAQALGIDQYPAVLYQAEDGEALYAAAGTGFPTHPYTLALEVENCNCHRRKQEPVPVPVSVTPISEAVNKPAQQNNTDHSSLLTGLVLAAVAAYAYYRDQTSGK